MNFKLSIAVGVLVCSMLVFCVAVLIDKEFNDRKEIDAARYNLLADKVVKYKNQSRVMVKMIEEAFSDGKITIGELKKICAQEQEMLEIWSAMDSRGKLANALADHKYK